MAECIASDRSNASGNDDLLKPTPRKAKLSNVPQMRTRFEYNLAQLLAVSERVPAKHLDTTRNYYLLYVAVTKPAISYSSETIRELKLLRVFLAQSKLFGRFLYLRREFQVFDRCRPETEPTEVLNTVVQFKIFERSV